MNFGTGQKTWYKISYVERFTGGKLRSSYYVTTGNVWNYTPC